MTITFAPLNESHFPLLLRWLESPHVKKWWPVTPKLGTSEVGDQDVTYTMDLVREKYSSYVKGYKLEGGVQKPIQAFIIHSDQNPVGYIQIYNAYDFPRSKPLLGLTSNLGAFDIFIGEEEVLKQGLGSKAILQLLKLHGNQYSYIFADPDSSNIAAIKCYAKAGFKKLSEQEDIKEVWMLKDLSSINQQYNLYIVILTYKVPLEKIDAFRLSHLDFLSNYYAKDFFIVSGPQVPRNGGIIIAKCDSKDVLQKLLDQDPFSINDLATYEIIEFSPTKRSKEFESIIFAQGQEDDLHKIQGELKSREPIFHHPEKFGKTKEDIERQMCDEFWEVGASGNVYTRANVIETLLERYNDQNYQDIWEAKDFALTKIAPDNYLLTYVLIQDKTRVTRRSTLWRKKNGDWKILYHQGTLIEGSSV